MKSQKILLILLFLSFHGIYAQTPQITLIDKNYKVDTALTHRYHFHRLVPTTNRVFIYSTQGKKIKLNNDDTIMTMFIGHGLEKLSKGSWIQCYLLKPRSGLEIGYVSLAEMKDVENEASAVDELYFEKHQKQEEKKSKRIFLTRFLPGVAIIILSIIVVISYWGRVTKCPKFKERFARKLLKRTEIDRHSYSYMGTGSKSVYANKTWVSVSFPEMKYGTRITYRKDYKCKKCGHTWSRIETKG